jgi:hypothetical protein
VEAVEAVAVDPGYVAAAPVEEPGDVMMAVPVDDPGDVVAAPAEESGDLMMADADDSGDVAAAPVNPRDVVIMQGMDDLCTVLREDGCPEQVIFRVHARLRHLLTHAVDCGALFLPPPRHTWLSTLTSDERMLGMCALTRLVVGLCEQNKLGDPIRCLPPALQRCVVLMGGTQPVCMHLAVMSWVLRHDVEPCQ